MVKNGEQVEKKTGIDMYKYVHHITLVTFKMSFSVQLLNTTFNTFQFFK